MGTTLQNGVYLPNEGERNCYAGLKTNWEILDQKVADVTALQQAVAGALHREIVVSLPTTDIDTATIYMILNGTSATENIYDEYMYISNAWELIGTSATDLTNYYTKGEVDSKLLLKASASDLTSHTGDTTIHVTASDKEKWDTVALIKQLRLVNAQVGSATTIAFSDFDDTNGIKVGDKCADLDVKVFEITAVDTANQTVTVGSALIDLALDSNVVHTNEINSSGIGIIGSVKEVGGVNFNTLTTQGLYGANASGSTNNPEASPCVVQVIRRQNSIVQIANVSSLGYKSRYIRYCADITVQSPVWQPWIKFATDDNVMHLSGDETSAGKKTFSDMSSFQGSYLGSEGSTNARTCMYSFCNRDTKDYSGIYQRRVRSNKAQGSMSGSDISQYAFDVLENKVRTNNVLYFVARDFVNDVPQTVYLTSQCTNRTLGSSNYPWTAIYSNAYYYGNIEFSNKFVTTDTVQDIAGNKNFQGLITTIPDATLWPATTNTTDDITYLGSNVIHVEQKSSGKLTDLSSGAWNVVELGTGCLFFRSNSGTDIRYKHLGQNTVNRIPVVSNANRQLNSLTPDTDNSYSLGDSTRRWKSINGINPGALSLPVLSSGLDISSYFTLDTSSNTYTPSVDGWICIKGVSSGSAAIYVESTNGFYISANAIIDINSTSRFVNLSFPVVKNEQYTIVLKSVNTSISAKFYPNLGNV